MSDQWYHGNGQQQFGPVTGQQLKQLASSGQLDPNDVVWKEGMPEWLPAAKVSGLFEVEEVTPAPPPLPVVQTASQNSPSSVASRYRKRKTSIPLIAGIGGGAVALLIVIIVVASISGSGDSESGGNGGRGNGGFDGSGSSFGGNGGVSGKSSSYLAGYDEGRRLAEYRTGSHIKTPEGRAALRQQLETLLADTEREIAELTSLPNPKQWKSQIERFQGRRDGMRAVMREKGID